MFSLTSTVTVHKDKNIVISQEDFNYTIKKINQNMSRSNKHIPT